MAKSVAVIGVNYIPNMGMKRLVDKLRNTMREPNLRFFNCGSSGAEIYQKILQLNVDKIIILDQFDNEDDDLTSFNYISINDQILIIGINPILFDQKNPSGSLDNILEQIIFRIKRLIIEEITLDSLA